MAIIKKRWLLVDYKISGKNVRYMPEYLHKKKVSVINFRLVDEQNAIVTIDFLDLSKFFAICKNMCYNKKVVRYTGVFAPLAYIKNNLSVFIGCILLAVTVALFNNVVLAVKFTGSGEIYSEQTSLIIGENNVKKYSLFSSIDYKELENEILTRNDKISFVTVKKQGNVLVVNTELSNEKPNVLGENRKGLESQVNGVVEEIVVLRGTPLVKEGDVVVKGQSLVGAFVVLKDESVVETFVVARVKILENKEYFYKCDIINEQTLSLAYALAKFELGGEVAEISHQILNGGINVIVTLRHTVYGG